MPPPSKLAVRHFMQAVSSYCSFFCINGWHCFSFLIVQMFCFLCTFTTSKLVLATLFFFLFAVFFFSLTSWFLWLLPCSQCPAGTCDGCTFNFLWESASSCPRCTEADYHVIEGACKGGVQVRHSSVFSFFFSASAVFLWALVKDWISFWHRFDIIQFSATWMLFHGCFVYEIQNLNTMVNCTLESGDLGCKCHQLRIKHKTKAQDVLSADWPSHLNALCSTYVNLSNIFLSDHLQPISSAVQ